MSKGIIYRLRTFTDVTDELGNGAASVMAVREKQGAPKPYIVVNSRLDDPHDNYDNQTLDAYMTSVVVVSDLVYTEGSNIGVKELAELVRGALHNLSGTYNGEVIREVVFEDEEEPIPIHITEEQREYEIMQTFRVYVERSLTTYTPISAFTYSNNPQVAAGAITTMTPTVTGDVNNYKIVDSDLTNYNASGLSLNASTGEITGTRTADASFEVIAVGKDGTLGSERVVVSLSSGGSIDITVNSSEYATVNDDTDIPVLNTSDEAVGTIVGSDVVIGDSDISLTYDSVEVDTATVKAEGAVVIPIDDLIPPITLTASIVSGNNTTIWDAAMEIDVLFTVNAPDASYSVTNAATLLSTYGLTWNEATRKLTGSPFANLSTGSNEITVTFEGSDGYTGTVNVVVTVVKANKWTPLELGTDLVCLFKTNEPDFLVLDANGYSLDRMNDVGGSSIYAQIDNTNEANKPVPVVWPHDENITAFNPDGQAQFDIINASDLAEDYKIFAVVIPMDDLQIIPNGKLNTQSWIFLNLTNSFRNYPNNQALNSSEWKNLMSGGGIFMFDPYNEIDEDAVTQKNDGSKYRRVHNGSGTMHQNVLTLSTLEIFRNKGTFVAFSVVKGSGCTEENINKFIGWAKHEYSLPNAEFDSEFEFYDNPPIL